MSGIFDKTISYLNNALDIQSERHKLTISNIANQNTPGYKAKDISFQDALKSAESGIGVKNMDATHTNHIQDGNSSLNLTSHVFETPSGSGLDQNSVNADMEMAKMSENGILYNTNVSLLIKKFNTLKSAIRGR